MGNEKVLKQTWKDKLLFYITAFFILLGTFSFFAFLFLVPFVIDPAFTTIFMEFDEIPALCVTVYTVQKHGASNCSWSSCREGCTKEMYDCTQIHVNYKRNYSSLNTDFNFDIHEHLLSDSSSSISSSIGGSSSSSTEMYHSKYEMKKNQANLEFSEYINGGDVLDTEGALSSSDDLNDFDEDYVTEMKTMGLQGNNSQWYYTYARLVPNVKGCGYPPILNCSIFLKTYKEIGTNFTCYYSKVDPGLVISDLDMRQVYMNLVYALAIPIPSFIISVFYLTIAYFKIYNDDEETILLEENAETMNMDGTQIDITPVSNAMMPIQPISEMLTPGSEIFREDLASFGQHYQVAMADELSRESFIVAISNSLSIPENLCKSMTTSISTPAGIISEL